MEAMQFLSVDHRLRSFCANISSTYGWYLNATSGAEDNLQLQRKIISGSRSYATLRSDLRRGCILPPIVLAIVSPQFGVDYERLTDGSLSLTDQTLVSSVQQAIESGGPSDFYIIDGLQRTNALRQVSESLAEDELRIFLGRPLRLEIWVNISFSALAYRMLLLNAGQRPMSVKMQVEILSQSLKNDLQSIPDLEIIDFGRRRVRSGQFQLSKLSLAFQAWLQGSPNVEIRNIVIEQMLADSALETLSASMSSGPSSGVQDRFRSLVEWMLAADVRLSDERLEFFGNETVLQGISAAVGSAQRDASLSERVDQCLTGLLRMLAENESLDPLGISTFDAVRKGIDPSRKNVGEATRNLVFFAFQEYFLTGGVRHMEECWQFAGARS